MEIPDQFKRFLSAWSKGDKIETKKIINEVVDSQDTTLIKCVACGEVVAFESTHNLLSTALFGVDAVYKYLVLDHIAKCRCHDVVIPVAGVPIHFSHLLEENLRKAYDAAGRDYEADLPNIVERWRLKCGV